MLPQVLVRVGVLGQVGRFTVLEGRGYDRSTRVVCRTVRGLEIGEVIAPVESSTRFEADGSVLRGITLEDDLLLARLERDKHEAYAACQTLLTDRGIGAVLMDVEHLFDGRSVYFYFLGEVTPEVEAITGELAGTYDTTIQFRQFADTLTNGCGPGCGTAEAENGCGSTKTGGGGCSTCAVASACKK